jgi:hypothetical protein
MECRMLMIEMVVLKTHGHTVKRDRVGVECCGAGHGVTQNVLGGSEEIPRIGGLDC